MGTPNNDLLTQLREAISSWTAEVGAAQRGLSQQIDGANNQLTRLLVVLHERQQLTTALARSNEELGLLKQTMQQGQLPAGAITRYTVAPTPATDAATRELDSTIGRLQTAVQSWTSQVAHSQGGLLEQFATANRQLTQLLEILTEPAGSAAAVSSPPIENAPLLQELEQLRHENTILSSEVLALNIEMETIRREQESFSTTNLAAETERVIKHRRDVERLEKALAGREAELEEQRHAFEALAREADTLRKETARLQISEDRLQLVAERQRQETAEHVTALSALSREMEAIRRAFLGEDVQVATQDLDLSETENNQEGAKDLVRAEARIAALESQLTHQELGREEVTVLEERIEALKEQLAALEQRPTAEAIHALEAHAVSLDVALSSAPSAEEFAALQAELAALRSAFSSSLESPSSDEPGGPAAERATELQSRIAELESELSDLSSRPTVEELAASVERATDLESRIAELESELSDLSSRPTAEELAAYRERADTLEMGLEQLRADSNAATGMASEATALRDQLVVMQTLLEDLDGRPEAGVLEEAQDRIAALEEELHTLESRLAISSGSQPELPADERAGLQGALAAMESELAALKRREEETVATARTLLEEMETHRTYEAAQATTLSHTRNEAVRLQDALTERQQQIAMLTNALASAEAVAARLEEEKATLSAAQAMEFEAATRALAEIQRDLDALQTAYDDHCGQAVAERAEFEAAAREREARIGVLEADLPGHAESLMKASALEEALRAACVRVEELEALAMEAEAAESEPGPELIATLAGQAAEVQRLSAELQDLREAGQSAGKRIEELEQQLERAASEHAELQARHAELTARHDQIVAELEALSAAETLQRVAVEEARKEADAALSAALEQEQALAVVVAELEGTKAVVATLESERASLGEETQERHREIRETMAQMSQVLHERDELSEELEAEKSRRGRIFAGSASAGKSAAEALESREERTRQQEILLSELIQPGQSRSLGDILVAAGILSRDQLSEALDEQQKDPTQLLGTILIERDYTTDDAIAQAVACQLEKPVVNPMEVHIQKDALSALNRDLCTWHVCIPLRITPDRLVVAMANPLDESAILKLRDVSQCEITPVVATPSHIMSAIDNYYGTF